MHIFWWNHGLHFHPDSQEEANMMVSLVENAVFAKPSFEQRQEDILWNQKVANGAVSTEFDPAL